MVGISSLGLDHLSLLGDTVEKIAVHKAGIMKPGVPTFTVPDQPGDTMRILKEKALEIQVLLSIISILFLSHKFILISSFHGQCSRLSTSPLCWRNTNGLLIR